MATAELDYTPSASDRGLTTPVARVRPAASPFPDEQFVTLPDVPVFAEHETKAKDGRTLRFGYHELAAVCERCNRRIRETGDYAAITLGHTPAPESGDPEPELIGFAGPWQMGLLGQPGARQRWAILADFHVFRDRAGELRKYPRRSPELWLEERFEDMFLDPIALLGAEPPRLDMGLLYFARRNGQLVERYCAAAPASGNVSPRSDHLTQYAAQAIPEGNMALSPEDIGQIVDALEQLDAFQFLKQLMASQSGNNASVPSADAPPSATPTASAAPEPPAAPDSPAPPAPPEVPASPPPPPGPAAPGGDSKSPADAASPPKAPAGDEDLEPKKYSAEELENMDDDEFEKYARGRRLRRQRRRYQAQGSSDESASGPKPASNPSVDPENVSPSEGVVSEETGASEAASSYQVPGKTEQYSLATAKQDVERLRVQLAETQQQLRNERATRVDAERYNLLQSRRQVLAFDLKDEFERTRYGRMSDEQFQGHLVAMDRNYRRIPADVHAPVFEGTVETSPDGATGRARYSKAESDKARQICDAKIARGEDADYDAVLESIHTGKPVQ
jgi:hypothetical protein